MSVQQRRKKIIRENEGVYTPDRANSRKDGKFPWNRIKSPSQGQMSAYKPYTAGEQKTGARTPAGDMQKIITRIQQIEDPALLAKISVFVESRTDDMEEKNI